MMTNNMKTAPVDSESTSSKEDPIHLFTAGLEYLIDYSKALLKEVELSGMDTPATVICMAPEVMPYLDFNDRVDFLDDKEDIMYIQEQQSGLLMAFAKGDLVSREADDGLLLIGPAVLFRSNEDESVYSVSSSDYRKAEEIYRLGQDEYEIGSVKVPAILIGQAGDITL